MYVYAPVCSNIVPSSQMCAISIKVPSLILTSIYAVCIVPNLWRMRTFWNAWTTSAMFISNPLRPLAALSDLPSYPTMRMQPLYSSYSSSSEISCGMGRSDIAIMQVPYDVMTFSLGATRDKPICCHGIREHPCVRHADKFCQKCDLSADHPRTLKEWTLYGINNPVRGGATPPRPRAPARGPRLQCCHSRPWAGPTLVKPCSQSPSQGRI